MINSVLRSVLFMMIISGFCLTTGCTVTTRTISPDEALHYDETYDFADKKKIVDTLVEPLLAEAPLTKAVERPVLIVYGIENRTSEHIDTSGITDDIREALMKAGRFDFISGLQRENIERELSYQYGGSVAPGERVQKARQAGAQYMLTGTLRSIEKKEPRQVRLKKKEYRYYKLTLDVTDIESGKFAWTDSVEIIREASKPFIGW